MKRLLLAGLALALILASASTAAPPPPPDERPEGSPEPCEHPWKDQKDLTPQPVSVQALPGSGLGFVKGTDNALQVRWIVQIRLRDAALGARVGSIVGMGFSGRYGLVAMTSGGYWLFFDLQGGELNQIAAIGVAPMRDAPGRPADLSFAPYNQAYVSFPDQNQIARFDLGACGVDARAELSPMAHGQPDRILPAYRLQQVTDPDQQLPEARIGVYEQWVLWRSQSDPNESLIQQSTRSPAKQDRQIARLTTPLAAMTSMVNPPNVHMWAAREGDEPGVFTLYAFAAKP